MIIKIEGTENEIIEFGKLLEAGKRHLARSAKRKASAYNLTTEEEQSIHNNNMINAIKLVRERLKIGLKEAKDHCENSPAGKAYMKRHNR